MSSPQTPLARTSVADAMHTGILMTDPDTDPSPQEVVIAGAGVAGLEASDP
jgi:hypothetical protein